ncbi:MAG: FeoB-associated Cys-rich membrane protein [Flexilinea sp.]
MEWILANIGTIIISIILLSAVFFAVRKIIYDARTNKCTGCPANCNMHSSCCDAVSKDIKQ